MGVMLYLVVHNRVPFMICLLICADFPPIYMSYAKITVVYIIDSMVRSLHRRKCSNCCSPVIPELRGSGKWVERVNGRAGKFCFSVVQDSPVILVVLCLSG